MPHDTGAGAASPLHERSVGPGLRLGWERIESRAPGMAAFITREQQSQRARRLVANLCRALGEPCPELAPPQPGKPPDFGPLLRGSLAHGGPWVAALIGRRRDWQAVGVDVEPHRALSPEASDYALDEVERAALARLPGGLPHWGLLAFGMKEALHKCVWPLMGLHLEFDEVRVILKPEGGLAGLEPRSRRAESAIRRGSWLGKCSVEEGAALSWLALAC